MVTPLQGFSTAGKHSPDRALVDTSRRGIGPGGPGATLIPDGGEKKGQDGGGVRLVFMNVGLFLVCFAYSKNSNNWTFGVAFASKARYLLSLS